MSDKKDNNPFHNIGKWQKKVNEPINPLFEVDQDKPTINPLIMIEDTPNSEDNFAILKTTENGKYLRGGLLFFHFNGVDIMTEPNNVIFVDRLNKSIFIKDYTKVTEEITPVNPELRQYIILFSTYNEDEEEVHLWEAMEGRTVAYNWIVDNIDTLGFDPDESFVLVETVPYKDALTVTQFVEYIKNGELVPEDGFDIQEYTS